MRIIILNGSPNRDGLTATCAQAFAQGAAEAGAKTTLRHLYGEDLRLCRACENGWGRCRREGLCVQDDAFAPLQQEIIAADALVIATPVYFGEPSELVRALLDRLRRCNVAPNAGQLRGKDFVGLCAAGGSGRGIGVCAETLERIAGHIGFRLADIILITRRNRAYKLPMITEAGRALVSTPWTE